MSFDVGTRPIRSPSSRRHCRSSSFVAKRRGTSPASRFAPFQLPKRSMTVCGWTVVPVVALELAWWGSALAPSRSRAAGRGSARPCSASDSGAELGERLRIDARARLVTTLASHANQNRAFWRLRKYGWVGKELPDDAWSARSTLAFMRLTVETSLRRAAGHSVAPSRGKAATLPGKPLTAIDPGAIARLAKSVCPKGA